MANINNFLGSGPIFPIELDINGAPIMRSGADLLSSSIKMILLWANSRILLGNFGSRYSELLEEPNDQLLTDLVTFFTFEALERWEKRIQVLGVDIISINDEKLTVSIGYIVTNSNIEEVLTFPFYRSLNF